MNLLKWFAVLFVFTLSTNVESCYNKQRLGFCPRNRRVFQKMCDGVKPWDCNYFELRCGCVKGAYRRKDGKCVAQEECDAETKKSGEGGGGKKSEATTIHPKDTPLPDIPESTPAQDTPIIKEEMYYSGDRHGCPEEVDHCIKACQNLGFLAGSCDPFLFRNCYCNGRRLKQPAKGPYSEKEERRLHFPYGRVLGSGDLILQLKEIYDCPNSEAECFSACNSLGVEGAFCRETEPHYCICEAHTSAYIWDEYQGQDSGITERGITNCTNQAICSGYCASLGEYRGFCSRDDPPLCYCYEMFSYGPTSGSLPERPAIYKSGDLHEPTNKFLQSREEIALVMISSSAWRRSKCVCMGVTFVEAKEDYALREVTCDVPQKQRNGVPYVEKQKANITFTVQYADGATTVQLKSDSERLPFGFQREYTVLSATNTCAVVLVSQVWRAKPLCALWGLVNARNNNEDSCFTTMEKFCMQPVSDAFIQRDRCGESYFEEMERYRKRLPEERIA